MPVDNMARYWHDHYRISGDPCDLGFVMHAIQDACVPHHAAGCLGNHHRWYEDLLKKSIDQWVNDPNFKNGVKALFDQWNKDDPNPPNALNVGDHNRVLRRNWRIDWLVTWLALNAYHAYSTVWNSFRSDNPQRPNALPDPDQQHRKISMRDLTQKAVAICMLALYEAGVSARCYGFDHRKAQVRKIAERWCIAVPRLPPMGGWRQIENFDSEEEAEFGLQIIKRYQMSRRCKAGRLRYYLWGDKAPPPPQFSRDPAPGEQCIKFDPNKLEVKGKKQRVPPGVYRWRWVIVQEAREIMDFGFDEDEARKTLYIIKRYQFNHYCWIGEQEDPAMEYFLKGPILIPVPTGIQPQPQIAPPGPIARYRLPERFTIPDRWELTSPRSHFVCEHW
jgi:hypothetical protein